MFDPDKKEDEALAGASVRSGSQVLTTCRPACIRT